MLLALLLSISFTRATYDDISLEDGGYKGVLVAIKENVPYDPNIPDNLRVSIICSP